MTESPGGHPHGSVISSTVSSEVTAAITLLGLDTADHLWVIELKVAPNSDTPLKALHQGLRYSAILDANRQAISTEVMAHKSASPTWPGVIAIAADSTYWDQWDHPKAGDWLSALKLRADRIASELGVEIVLLDFGAVETEFADGSARLTAPLDVRTRWQTGPRAVDLYVLRNVVKGRGPIGR